MLSLINLLWPVSVLPSAPPPPSSLFCLSQSTSGFCFAWAVFGAQGTKWGPVFLAVLCQTSTGYQYVDEQEMLPSLSSLHVSLCLWTCWGLSYSICCLLFIKQTLCPLGTRRGKKHGSLCRLPLPTSTHTPLLILPPSLHPQPTVSSLQSWGRVIHSELCLSTGSDQDGGMELSRGIAMHKEGGTREENKRGRTYCSSQSSQKRKDRKK